MHKEAVSVICVIGIYGCIFEYKAQLVINYSLVSWRNLHVCHSEWIINYLHCNQLFKDAMFLMGLWRIFFPGRGFCVRRSVMMTSVTTPYWVILQSQIDYYDVVSGSPYQHGTVISMVTAFLCYVISSVCGCVRENITHSQPWSHGPVLPFTLTRALENLGSVPNIHTNTNETWEY